MSEALLDTTDRSPLRVGALMTVVGLGLAGLIGVIAVFDAGDSGSAVGIGAATAVTVFGTGATIACGLACLVRRRAELLALGGIAASGLAVDLFALAIWREITDETYGKIAAIAFVWSFFGLLMLGLTLAVRPRESLARALYPGALVAAAAGGLVATVRNPRPGAGVPPGGCVEAGLIGVVAGVSWRSWPVGGRPVWDERLLRPLAATLVLLSALWFGALAASRLEQR